MLLFVLTGDVPAYLAVLLAFLVYLAFFDLRGEPLDGQVKLWWILLVALTGVLGYVALRVWLFSRRRGAAGPA